MRLLRMVLLGVALTAGVTGSVLMTPTVARAGEFTTSSHAFQTAQEAEEFRATYCPIAPGTPYRTYVKFKQFGPKSAGFYVCYAVPF